MAVIMALYSEFDYQCLAEQGELLLPLIYFGLYGTHVT